LRYSEWETEILRRREGGAEFGGDGFEALFPLEMRDALHAAATIARIPRDDVDVDMKDLLPGRPAIIDPEVEAGRA